MVANIIDNSKITVMTMCSILPTAYMKSLWVMKYLIQGPKEDKIWI